MDFSRIIETSKDSEKKKRCKKGDLSEKEKFLFDGITNGNIDQVKALLGDGIRIDCLDEHGMTPLQHAAYKGNVELCEVFLNHGADINSNEHEHGYTALMFAALSGSKPAVQFLLEHGAKSTMENTVHRTAAQMAAFVGQHQIVSLINNFFQKEDLDYYCVPRGLENEPKLPPSLSSPLYKFIVIVNLNPVRLSLYLQKVTSILENVGKVTKVLDLLCEKMMKQRETNEVMALKFHYHSYLIRQADTSYRDQNKNLDVWIKYLLKGRASDGFPEVQEQLIRSMLKSFPYIECQLLQQIVCNLSTSPTQFASNILTSCINGLRFATSDDQCCNTCGEFNAKTCVSCKSVFYCNKECQRLHWFVHKKHCKKLAEIYKENEEQRKLEEKKAEQEQERQNRKNELEKAQEEENENNKESSDTSEDSNEHQSDSSRQTVSDNREVKDNSKTDTSETHSGDIKEGDTVSVKDCHLEFDNN